MNFHYKLFIVIAIVIIKSMLNEAASLLKQDIDLANQLDTKNVRAIAAQIQTIVFKGDSLDTATIVKIPITQPEVIYDNLDLSKPVTFYVHGFREDPSYENTQLMVSVYLQRGEHNILSFDWSKLGFDNYGTVVRRAKTISLIFADALTKLVSLGLDIESCHIVGHSLGGQISGLIWKFIDFTLPRVTALDPAYPGFYHTRSEHIDNRSANFVDVIHTDRGFYGARDNTGIADYYPNDGKRPQPGCPRGGLILTPKDLCSHWRSWRFYAESVIDPDSFLATRCDNFKDYMSGKCENNRVIPMGYAAPTDACGSFFLTTRDKLPFGENSSE